MNLHELKNKKILIVGYGKEGKSVERFLQAKVPDCSIHITDKSQGADYLDSQIKYDIAIRSPGVPKYLIKIPHTTATNLFFANIGKNITIGVTGSKGKSTTATLIHHILSHAHLQSHLVGNIGNPMLDELLKSHSERDIYVCELSSYQLDDIQYSPHISVLVSLFPEHINYHGTQSAYYEAKKNILNYSTDRDYYIYNPLFDVLHEWSLQVKCKSISYISQLPLSRKQIPLLGDHNVQNVQAAYTVAKLLNLEDSVITEAIKTFKPLPHRLEFVGEYKGILFYDDAISTTPESTIEAIKALKKVDTILLGGENRGYNFTELAECIREYEIKNVVLFPNSGEAIARTMDKADSKKLKILHTASMDEAVQYSYQHTAKGKICLLSTASPSYSLWKNFEEKGTLFQTFVMKYK